MLIHYCDLCGVPMKTNTFFVLYCSAPDKNAPNPEDYEDIQDYYKEYIHYISKITKDVKTICPKCKAIYDQMFSLRLQRLCELSAEINNIYNLPSKSNPKDRKNKNGKK